MTNTVPQWQIQCYNNRHSATMTNTVPQWQTQWYSNKHSATMTNTVLQWQAQWHKDKSCDTRWSFVTDAITVTVSYVVAHTHDTHSNWHNHRHSDINCVNFRHTDILWFTQRHSHGNTMTSAVIHCDTLSHTAPVTQTMEAMTLMTTLSRHPGLWPHTHLIAG